MSSYSKCRKYDWKHERELADRMDRRKVAILCVQVEGKQAQEHWGWIPAVV